MDTKTSLSRSGKNSANQHLQLIHADSLEWMKQQPDNSVDLVFGSPPYPEKGMRYGSECQNMSTEQWIDWMLEVTTEAIRISRGLVIWVVNGAIRKRRYLPACEGLVWKWYERGGWSDRSVIWSKSNALPNRMEWFINTHEPILIFKQPRSRQTFNWKEVAQPPKDTKGGDFAHRDSYGRRTSRGRIVPPNPLARPRDVLQIPVGGNNLGHPLAHDNEAPFPLKLAEHFVRVCSNRGETVLDIFSGSGTTLHAALIHGRKGIGVDSRQSQIRLAKRRLADVQRTLQRAA